MSRLHASMPAPRVLTGCDKVLPVAGVGRIVCGWLFSGNGPSQFSITRQENGHWAGLAARLNDDPLGKSRTSQPPYTKTGHSECWQRAQLLSNGIAAGYMQANVSWDDIDIQPRFGFYSPAGGQSVIADYDGYSAFIGNTIITFRAVGLLSQGQQVLDTGGARIGVEIRPSDKYVRGWSDSTGADPRVTGVGITTAIGPFVPYLSAYNGQNGFKGTAAYSTVVVCREHAVNFNVPAARSVRVSVAGVVQSFPGPVNYINLPAGVGSFDPAAGIWWPSVVRYEFFTAAALGGILLADLTVQRSWGGDTIGMV